MPCQCQNLVRHRIESNKTAWQVCTRAGLVCHPRSDPALGLVAHIYSLGSGLVEMMTQIVYIYDASGLIGQLFSAKEKKNIVLDIVIVTVGKPSASTERSACQTEEKLRSEGHTLTASVV
jgi:hypothetical protein